MKPNNPTQDKAELYRTYLKTSAVGLEVVLSVAAGLLGGFLIDRFFQCKPWGLITGFVFGVLAAGRSLYVFCRRYLKQAHKDD